MKAGDFLALVFKWTGIKWLVNKIVIDWLGYESCGCKDRQARINEIHIDWEKKWLDS
jgi:hypothetical protein